MHERGDTVNRPLSYILINISLKYLYNMTYFSR